MLDKYQQEALSSVKSGKNVFITGVAGTGKSFLLSELRKELDDCDVTATTGIAAVNINGVTIHSFAGVGLAKDPVNIILQKMSYKAKKRIQECNTLIIDEVSMMSGDLMEKLHYVFAVIKDKSPVLYPFGGVQVILFGDFLQLAPVTRFAGSDFCFDSSVWDMCKFEYIQLKHVHRQEDKRFVEILTDMRSGIVTEESEKILKSREFNLDDDIVKKTNPVVLTSLNKEADIINKKELSKIDAKEIQLN